jgi:peptide-methionine (S)-S-oxide reductase
MDRLGKLMSLMHAGKTEMVSPEEALPGRSERPYDVPQSHAVLGTPLEPPFPEGTEVAYFALGCFWGAERLFWELDGVYTTAVGYQNGTTPNPTYEEVCTAKTGHAEAVLVAFDPKVVSYADLLKVFFEEHDPTQGMRQGNDVGTQYRSGIYFTNDAQKATAEMAVAAYDKALREAGKEPVTTEVEPAGPFYYAEDYHQQYLHKVPNGYCGLKGTGVACTIPAPAA